MPATLEVMDRLEQVAGDDGTMVIEFEYRGTTYSTADEDPNIVDSDEEGDENGE